MSRKKEGFEVVLLPGWGNKKASLDALWERFSKSNRRKLSADAAAEGVSPKEYLRRILSFAHKENLPPPEVMAAIENVLSYEDEMTEEIEK